MRIVIRKLGNSAGVILPAALMKDLGLAIDQGVDLSAVDGCLVIKPLTKPTYKLADLVAEMNGELPRADGWEEPSAVGKELDW